MRSKLTFAIVTCFILTQPIWAFDFGPFSCVDRNELETSALDDIDINESIPTFWVENEEASFSYGDTAFSLEYFMTVPAIGFEVHYFGDPRKEHFIITPIEQQIGVNAVDATAHYVEKGEGELEYGCFLEPKEDSSTSR